MGFSYQLIYRPETSMTDLVMTTNSCSVYHIDGLQKYLPKGVAFKRFQSGGNPLSLNRLQF